jgi:hypothetical protein
LNYSVLPYTKIIIPDKGSRPEKIIYAPILDTFLFHKSKQTNFSFRSLVDSGADFCVFPAKYGSVLGFDIKKGRPIVTSGIGGNETLYFHTIAVGIIVRKELWKFQCEAGFSFKMNSKGTGLLGRRGFFDLFQEVAFNQQTSMFRLKGEGPRHFMEIS